MPPADVAFPIGHAVCHGSKWILASPIVRVGDGTFLVFKNGAFRCPVLNQSSDLTSLAIYAVTGSVEVDILTVKISWRWRIPLPNAVLVAFDRTAGFCIGAQVLTGFK